LPPNPPPGIPPFGSLSKDGAPRRSSLSSAQTPDSYLIRGPNLGKSGEGCIRLWNLDDMIPSKQHPSFRGEYLVNERQLKLIWMLLILLVLVWIGWNLMRLSQNVVP
jgi:hypothetical protein